MLEREQMMANLIEAQVPQKLVAWWKAASESYKIGLVEEVEKKRYTAPIAAWCFGEQITAIKRQYLAVMGVELRPPIVAATEMTGGAVT